LKYVHIEDVKEIADKQEAYFMIEGKAYHLNLAYQKTGFGRKAFLLCPKCGSRRTKMYLYGDGLMCRGCLPVRLYRGLTDTGKGSYKSIAYRMNRLAERNGIQLKMPFCYMDYPKPKGKNADAWSFLLSKLQALENMRNQAIFFNKRYSDKTIRSVIHGNNALLYVCDPYDLYKYFYNWDEGFNNYPGNTEKESVTAITARANKYQCFAIHGHTI